MALPADYRAHPPWHVERGLALYLGDAHDVLRTFRDESVQCAVTSPPYYGLRDYGTGAWEGGDPTCDHDARAPFTQLQVPPGTDKQASNRGANDLRRYRTCVCGAERVDRQVGLEQTPQKYVERLTEVFRELRRVLRDDGVFWLNIGDSYNSRSPNRQGVGSSSLNDGRFDFPVRDATRDHPGRDIRSLKQKDLILVGPMLAQAMQEPYYAGTIKDERDRIWLAAMIEAEGCIYIHKRHSGEARSSDTFSPFVQVSNTNREILERFASLTGIDHIDAVVRDSDDRRRQTLYRWYAPTIDTRQLLSELYLYLVSESKRHQARIAIGTPSSGTKADAAHLALKLLHEGSLTDVDFPVPASMFEPGWYLRSQVIWWKSNAMPSSAKTRPGLDYEYVYMFSKKPTYYFDMEAVKQTAAWERWGRQTVPKHRGSKTGAGFIRERSKEEVQEMGGKERNLRTVWSIPTRPWRGAHFAAFPPTLVETCVAASTPEAGSCSVCGTPWRRVVEADRSGMILRSLDEPSSLASGMGVPHHGSRGTPVTRTLGWEPVCDCGTEPTSAIVLDPFMGSGTTAYQCAKMGRRCVGIDLKEEYLRMTVERFHEGKEAT